MTVTLALAGDTMLARGVGQTLERSGPGSLFSDEVVEAMMAADLFVLNLECCISERGEPWPAPGKAFFFRAPPVATEVLATLGVDCVTLANNHAMDFGEESLLDTLEHLGRDGIAWVGAGPAPPRGPPPPSIEGGGGGGRPPAPPPPPAPTFLEANGFRLAVLGVTDHPMDFAATSERPGVALGDLRREVPAWLTEAVEHASSAADAVLVTPHWGPNMAREPVAHVRAAAKVLCEAGATVIAGHSAHIFHGVSSGVMFDLGDFVDDYMVDPVLRNDLGLLNVVTLDDAGPSRVEALPLKLDYCHTNVARGEDAAWIRRRFRKACAALGTDVGEEDGRLVIELRREESRPGTR
jgi:poly-gamma-glutamate capsule biosynthesis protein CapA/YwtB (metallophosphatase superfamily)